MSYTRLKRQGIKMLEKGRKEKVHESKEHEENTRDNYNILLNANLSKSLNFMEVASSLA